MSLARVTGPETEPLDLADVKLHLRLEADYADEDTLLTGLIASAREHTEQRINRAIGSQAYRLRLDCFPCADTIDLGMPDVTGVTSFSYVSSAGQSVDFTDYTLDVDTMPSRVVRTYGAAWPAARVQRNAITIEFTVGDDAAVPHSLKAAMLLLIGHWYENRETVAVGITVTTVPLAYEALIGPWRRPAMEMA